MKVLKLVTVLSTAILLCASYTFAATNVGTSTETDQSQGQNQGQGQTLIDRSFQSMSLIQEAGEAKIGPHISPDINFAPVVPNFVAPKHKGSRFMSMYDMLKYKQVKEGVPAVFTRAELEQLAEVALDESTTFWGNTPGLKPRILGGDELEAVDSISVTFFPTMIDQKTGNLRIGKQDNFTMKGVVHSAATEDNLVSLDILAMGLIYAMDEGLNAADVVVEDVTSILSATGLGLGFNISGASSTNDTGKSAVSGVSGGGTGWSNTKSSFKLLPFMQMVVGVIN